MKIEVSIGEVIDKITILQIKENNIKDPIKLKHIKKELQILNQTLIESNIIVPNDLVVKLRNVNQRLWDCEEVLRLKEKNKEYDSEFIKYAVDDAVINDERFLVKNEINNICNSNIKEQKSYDGLYESN